MCNSFTISLICFVMLLPPASAVEVIESEPSFRLCGWTLSRPIRLTYDVTWSRMTDFQVKRLENVQRGRCMNAQVFSFFLISWWLNLTVALRRTLSQKSKFAVHVWQVLHTLHCQAWARVNKLYLKFQTRCQNSLIERSLWLHFFFIS